jgi:hypothetical protein
MNGTSQSVTKLLLSLSRAIDKEHVHQGIDNKRGRETRFHPKNKGTNISGSVVDRLPGVKTLPN